MSTNLNRASTWMAADMGAKNYFSHTDSLGRSPSTRAQNCDYPSGAGENIAAGGAWGPASAVFNAWRNSSGHNANMLNGSYRQIGIARVYTAGSRLWLVLGDGLRAGERRDEWRRRDEPDGNTDTDLDFRRGYRDPNADTDPGARGDRHSHVDTDAAAREFRPRFRFEPGERFDVARRERDLQLECRLGRAGVLLLRGHVAGFEQHHRPLHGDGDFSDGVEPADLGWHGPRAAVDALCGRLAVPGLRLCGGEHRRRCADPEGGDDEPDGRIATAGIDRDVPVVLRNWCPAVLLLPGHEPGCEQPRRRFGGTEHEYHPLQRAAWRPGALRAPVDVAFDRVGVHGLPVHGGAVNE